MIPSQFRLKNMENASTTSTTSTHCWNDENSNSSQVLPVKSKMVFGAFSISLKTGDD